MGNLHYMKKILKAVYFYAITAAAFVMTVVPGAIKADIDPATTFQTPVASATGQTTVLPAAVADPEAPKTLTVRITAYTSSPDETDSTPFLTANGTKTQDGVVATNILPFGTKIKIPELFGDKIFTVQDRMAKRMKNVVDVWMSTKAKALRFGVEYTDIVIIRDADKEISKL